jgi:hypothetical protein
MTAVDVTCRVAPTDGWSCTVTVEGPGGERTVHEVRVRTADLARLDPGAADPAALVEASFAFLLEREPPSSILRAFDLPVIGRYFPDYEAAIRRGRAR